MESRRGKRGGGSSTAETASIDSIKSSPKSVQSRASSKSPSRRTSPSRNRSPARSTARSSPARTRSPGRPSSKLSVSSSVAPVSQRRSARKKTETKIFDNDTASETDDSKSDVGSKPTMELRLSPLRLDKLQVNKKTGAIKVIKASTTTTSSANVKVSNITNEGDDEVARLTAKYLQAAENKLRSTSTNLGLINNLTPSELSGKRSYSRSISRSVIDDDEWSHSDQSDKGDLYANRITRSRSKQASALRRTAQNNSNDSAGEFGGSIVATILILILSILCFSAQYVCSRPECNLQKIRIEKLKQLSTYVTLEASYLYLGLAWTVYLLSAIPYLGLQRQLPQLTTTNESKSKQFYFNGFSTALIILLGLGITEYYFKYPILAIIYKNYQPFIFISLIYAIITSIWCFVRSTYFPENVWNPKAKCGRLFSDLFIGREITPRWFNVIDIKLSHLRIALITTLVWNVIFIVRNVKIAPLPVTENPLNVTEIATHIVQNATFDPVAVTISSLIVLYAYDVLIFEHHLVSSFELQHEGVGAQLLLRYAMLPIWTSVIAKYALQNRINGVPKWLLIAVSIVFIVGLVLKRLSNKLKYQYRLNPNSKQSQRE